MFWKTSSKINKIIIRTTLILFFLIFLIPIIYAFDKRGQQLLFSFDGFLKALSIAASYFPFAFLTHIFVLSHYLRTQWENIKSMKIDPWPLHKPYISGPFSYNSTKKEYKSSMLTEIFNFEQKTPFSWFGFFALVLLFIGAILIWSGLESLAFNLFRNTYREYYLGLIKTISGITSLYIGTLLWKKKLKK